VKDVVDWVDHNPNAELEEFEHKKKELEELWKPIIMNVYGAGSVGGGGMPNMGNFQDGPTAGPQIDEVD